MQLLCGTLYRGRFQDLKKGKWRHGARFKKKTQIGIHVFGYVLIGYAELRFRKGTSPGCGSI